MGNVNSSQRERVRQNEDCISAGKYVKCKDESGRCVIVCLLCLFYAWKIYNSKCYNVAGSLLSY